MQSKQTRTLQWVEQRTEQYTLCIQQHIGQTSSIARPRHNDSYLTSYPHLCAFWTDRPVTKESLVQGTHMVYGWMPTTLNVDKNPDVSIEQAAVIASRLRERPTLPALQPFLHDLEVLKAVVNNSIVGTSKLLHFMRPDVYPIWDSIVHQSLQGVGSTNDTRNYIAYCRAIHKMLPSCGDIAMERINRVLSENPTLEDNMITPVRAMELILFLKAKAR